MSSSPLERSGTMALKRKEHKREQTVSSQAYLFTNSAQEEATVRNNLAFLFHEINQTNKKEINKQIDH